MPARLVASLDGQLQSRRAHAVVDIERRAGREQQRAHVTAAEGRREVEGGGAARVDGAHVRAPFQQQLDDLSVVLPCCSVQRRDPVLIARVDG